MKTLFTDDRKPMRTVVVACCLALAALLLTTLSAHAQQPSYNPYLVQGTVSPAPLLPVEFNGTGVLAFDVGNTGSSNLVPSSGQKMRLVITLSKGVPNVPNPSDPVAALAALGGDGVAGSIGRTNRTILLTGPRRRTRSPVRLHLFRVAGPSPFSTR